MSFCIRIVKNSFWVLVIGACRKLWNFRVNTPGSCQVGRGVYYIATLGKIMCTVIL